VVEPGWRGVSEDPNSSEAHVERQRQLDAAWAAPPADRVEFIQERCRGRRVLDLGCAGQATRLDSPDWFHRKVLDVARSCVGADYERAEVERLKEAGFDVVFADVSAGPGELADREPFDVVVAGELIEHLPAPQSLLSFAAEVLVPGGSLIITTPNPYALRRVTPIRSRTNRDNVDHVVALFPSGMAEMADREGFRLAVSTTTRVPPRREELWRTVKGELWHRRYPSKPWPAWLTPLSDVVAAWRTWPDGQLGETSIYVLERR